MISKQILLTQLESIPYTIELRDTVNAGIYLFDALVVAGNEVVRAQDEANASRDAADRSAQLRAQAHLFDTLESFLTAFARASLLLFPVSRSPFAQKRGATMQQCLAQDYSSSPLNDRDLRDSWMHHDERMDSAVEARRSASGQTFTRSGERIDAETDAHLRVIEADSLVIHFRDRAGAKRSRNLHEIAAALREVDARRVNAFKHLVLE